MYYQKIIEELSMLPEVEAITLGGSRSTNYFDDYSDYDVYVYLNKELDKDVRKNILQKYCSYMEIDNRYFELEDDCVLKNKVSIELIYRNVQEFNNISLKPQMGFSTCYLFNICHSKIEFDRNNFYQRLKDKHLVYNKEFKSEIIKLNLSMLSGVTASYDMQIIKAVKRKDKTSINHRIAAYLASYFDIIFAMNNLYHPGEKRMVEHAIEKCKYLPNNFKSNIDKLLCNKDIEKTLRNMYINIKNILVELELI